MSVEKLPPRKRGEMERRTRKLIKAMRLAGTPEQEMLVAQALAGARTMDEAMADGGKRYIITVGHRLQREALAALRASVGPLEPEPAKADERDDLALWIAAIHRPTVDCTPVYPRVLPGVCAACDSAVVARAVYGRRHPEEPGHAYGMNRRECGCPSCVAEETAAQGGPDGGAGD